MIPAAPVGVTLIGGENEQRAAILASEHARNALLLKRDALNHLPALTHTYNLSTRWGGNPNRTLRVETDTVGQLV